MSVDVKKLLAEAQLPKRVVLVCTRGDLTAEAQRLDEQLQEAEASAKGRLVGNPRSLELARELETLREQMRNASIEFELTAFSPIKWRALKAEHPIGKDPSQADVVLGADAKSLFNAAVPLATTSPQLDAHDWNRLIFDEHAVLPQGEWNKLVDAVWALNEEGTSLPFSSRAYAILRAQSDDSASPATSA